MSPPNSNHKESTKIETSQFDLSAAASPAFTRSEDIPRGRANSFTKLKPETLNKSNSRSKRSSKLKISESELVSDDDQPSGSCQFVGDQSGHSTINANSINNSHDVSVRRRQGISINKSSISSSSTINRTQDKIVNLTPPTPASKSSSACGWFSLVLVSVCVMLGVATVQEAGLTEVRQMLWTMMEAEAGSMASAEHWKYIRQQFSSDLAQIKAKFPNQSSATWRMIGATLKSPLQPLPDYPAVLLLVASPPAVLASQCLASQLLEISSNALTAPGLIKPHPSQIIVNAKDYLGLDPHLAKEKLTDNLHNSLSSWNTAGINSLELLHPTAALTLHAFADNSNAPYKQSIMIMTIEDDADESDEAGCNVETRAEKILSQVWRQELGYDKFSALISRIVVSVANVREETGAVC